MVVQFCGRCSAKTQGVASQVVCNVCGEDLDLTKAGKTSQQDHLLSGEGTSDQPFELGDSPVSSRMATVSPQRLAIVSPQRLATVSPQRFQVLSGAGELARQRSIERTAVERGESIIYHAGGAIKGVHTTKRPVLGKEVATGKKIVVKGNAVESLSTTVQLHCGYYAPEDEEKSDRIQVWKADSKGSPSEILI
jgi:hypothetical protein